MMENRKISTEKLFAAVKKYKYILIVLTAGLIILMIPTGSAGKETDTEEEQQISSGEFSLEEQESKLESILNTVNGAGEVQVMLTLKTSTEQVLAQDSEINTGREDSGESREEKITTVIVTKDSGNESAVALKYIYPEYQGALIVAEGADNANVQYEITQAVSSLTGLGADKVTVVKMKK